MFFLKKKRQGFTLMELVIVIGIIGILATIGMTSYASVSKSARDARRKSDVSDMLKAIKSYQIESDSALAIDNNCAASNGKYGNNCTAGALRDNWRTANNPYKTLVNEKYMSHLPIDPVNDKLYFYRIEKTANGGRIGAKLEKSGDMYYLEWEGL